MNVKHGLYAESTSGKALPTSVCGSSGGQRDNDDNVKRGQSSAGSACSVHAPISIIKRNATAPGSVSGKKNQVNFSYVDITRNRSRTQSRSQHSKRGSRMRKGGMKMDPITAQLEANCRALCIESEARGEDYATVVQRMFQQQTVSQPTWLAEATEQYRAKQESAAMALEDHPAPNISIAQQRRSLPREHPMWSYQAFEDLYNLTPDKMVSEDPAPEVFNC